jgi:hypothetical protein
MQRHLKEKSSQPGVLREGFEGFSRGFERPRVRWGSEVSGIVPDRERLNSIVVSRQASSTVLVKNSSRPLLLALY